MGARRHARKPIVYPIILAAGPRAGLPCPKALAPFGEMTALERAVETCAKTPGLARAIVVLGCEARRVVAAWQNSEAVRARRMTIVRNAGWRRGQLTSLIAGLRRVPKHAAGFLLYPVDYPLLTPLLIGKLLRAFHRRAGWKQMVVPAIGRRSGHPILVVHDLAAEFRACARRGGTARDVIYRVTEPDRVLRVPIQDRAIFRDFDSKASYRKCLRMLRSRAEAENR